MPIKINKSDFLGKVKEHINLQSRKSAKADEVVRAISTTIEQFAGRTSEISERTVQQCYYSFWARIDHLRSEREPEASHLMFRAAKDAIKAVAVKDFGFSEEQFREPSQEEGDYLVRRELQGNESSGNLASSAVFDSIGKRDVKVVPHTRLENGNTHVRADVGRRIVRQEKVGMGK